MAFSCLTTIYERKNPVIPIARSMLKHSPVFLLLTLSCSSFFTVTGQTSGADHVTVLPSGTSQGVITLSPGTSKGVVTLNVGPTPTILSAGTSKGVAALTAADPKLAIVLTPPSKTNPMPVKPYSPAKSAKAASVNSALSANMALNLASSPALVQQWNNSSVLWLLPYTANGNSLSSTNWVNTGQNFWSNPDASPDLLMLDINGDGKTDLVQQWNNNGTLWLLPYISNGTSFTPTNWINTGQGYISGPGGTPGLLALDINGDGMTDLVEQWNNNGTLYLLPYISNGTGFTTTNWIDTGQGFGSGPNGTPGLVVLDINGDGKMDLVQQWNDNGAFYLLPYISNGTGFSTTNWINTGNGFGSGPGGTPGLLSLDINGDGKTDLMQQWNNNGTLWLLPYISSGTGFYTTNWINTQQNYGTGYGGTPWLLPMDLNGDGQTDLVQQWNNNGTLWLLPYISNGTSFATTNWINTQQGFAVPGLIALDINGDGKTDLVQQWNNNGTLWLLPYISSGTTLSTTNWINTGQGYASGPSGTPGLLGGSYINPAQNGGSAAPALPSCESISPGYLGSSQVNGPGAFTAAATVSSNAVSVTFLIYNEQTSSLSGAAQYQGSLTNSNAIGYKQFTVSPPFSAFQSTGTYAVTAQAQDQYGNKATCSASTYGFFDIQNIAAEPTSLNGQSTTKCSNVGGSWTDSAGIASGESVDRWDLTQSGNTVSGTQTVSNGGACGDVVWQVSGTLLDSTQATFRLNASSPSVSEDACGYLSATLVTINPLTLSGAACDSASGTENDIYPPGYGSGNFSTTLTSTPTIPNGAPTEQSQFDQWGPDGFSNQGLFKGQLITNPPGSNQFAGRHVQESLVLPSNQQCAQDDPSGLVPTLSTNPPPGPPWTVLIDSSYTDDWIGYGPAYTRYIQTYIGSCALTAGQTMSISSDNNTWTPYKTNQLIYAITPKSVTATRDNASQSRSFPN